MIYKIIILALIIYFFFPTYTPKIKSKNGISKYYRQEINGTKLQFMIRGENIDNSVILYIHGGPCVPEIPYIRKYQNLLERDFTIVNYDQRGTGKSYSFKEDYSKITSETHIEDIIELTKYIKNILGKDKIILMGHSWGTYIGLQAVYQNPNDYSHYIGIGQVSDVYESETLAITKVIEEAQKQGNIKDIELILQEKDKIKQNKFVNRSILRKYGFTARNINETTDYIKAFLIGPEYNRYDFIKFILGTKYQGKIGTELFQKPLTELVKNADIPIYFVMGKYDGMTSPEVAKKYLNSIDTTKTKEFILFENSGHYPHFEEKEEFHKFMLKYFHK